MTMASTTTTATPWFSDNISWATAAAIITSLIVTIVAVLVAAPQPSWNWDVDVLPLARQYNPTPKNNKNPSNSSPLQGVVVVITGGTSGIGLGLTKVITRLGAHVVVVGRSPFKLQQLVKDLQGQQPQQEQQQQDKVQITTFVADLEDLASVANAADQIRASFPRIDILINNAGLHRGVKMFDRSVMKQGYDLAFGVNYLLHFLLTEKLMPSLLKSTKPRIVQISSTFHVAVDGSDLVVQPPPLLSRQPVASQPGGSRGFYVFRTQRQYANSKLAQILHARALQRRYVPTIIKQQQQKGNKQKANNSTWIRSACPAWVGTNIAGDGLFHLILSTFGFPVQGWGLSSILHAIFEDDENSNSSDGGSSITDQKANDATTVSTMAPVDDFFANTYWTVWLGPLMFRLDDWLFGHPFVYKVGLQDVVMRSGANVILLTQKWLPYTGPSLSSPESYNTTLQDQLYQWSREAVAPWL